MNYMIIIMLCRLFNFLLSVRVKKVLLQSKLIKNNNLLQLELVCNFYSSLFKYKFTKKTVDS